MPERAFFRRHPGLLLFYSGGAAVLAMAVFHPLWAGVSFACACAGVLLVCGPGHLVRQLKLALPLMTLVAAINPLVNRQGATLLFYLGRLAVTRESAYYGLCSAAMLGAALLWLGCAGRLLGDGRMLYLLAPLFPGSAMVLSMVVRLIPAIRRKLGDVLAARRALEGGRDPASARQKLARGATVFAALFAWSMEDGIETADAMKARGYGAGRRTSAVAYTWLPGDTAATATLALLLGGGLCCLAKAPYTFFPRLTSPATGPVALLGAACYGLALLLPLWEECLAQWRRACTQMKRRAAGCWK